MGTRHAIFSKRSKRTNTPSGEESYSKSLKLSKFYVCGTAFSQVTAVASIFICLLLWRSWLLNQSLDVAVHVNTDGNSRSGHYPDGTSANVHNEESFDSDFGKKKLSEGKDMMESDLPSDRRASVLLTKEMVKATIDRGRTAMKALEPSELSQSTPNAELLAIAAGYTSTIGQGKKVLNSPFDKVVKDREVEKFFTKGYWFVPGQKYFVFQPSGGMSNQRIILEYAILVAKTLKRTLIVPPLCPHTSMFWNYNKVEWDRTVEAFQIFSQERVEGVVPAIGLSNCILRRFVEYNENRHGQSWMRIQREKKGVARGPLWTSKDLASMFGNLTVDVLFFSQTSMWKSFDFTPEEIEFAQNHVQLNSELRRVARIAVQRLYPDGVFNSLHIRFEDKYTQLLTDKLSSPKAFIRRLNNKGVLALTNKLYIATQPSKITSPYFDAFRDAGYEIVFSDSLLNNTDVLKFLNKFSKTDIQTSILGLLEQLICARANYFLGTGFSTFSRYIRIKRNNKALLYDESLLLPKYRRDESFGSHCTVQQLKDAFMETLGSNMSPTLRKRVQQEYDLISLDPPCEKQVVSLRIC